MHLSFKLKITDSNQVIKDEILAELSAYVGVGFLRAEPAIQNRIRSVVVTAIKNQPEYSSLKNGRLRHELGLDNAEARVDGIVDFWAQAIRPVVVPPSKKGNSLSGGIKLEITDDKFSREILLPEATIQPRNSPPFCWLEFLLLEGDAVKLAPGYAYINRASKSSRSGRGIMISSKSRQWRIPPEFAGVAGNNWFTRALDDAKNEIDDAIAYELMNVL